MPSLIALALIAAEEANALPCGTRNPWLSAGPHPDAESMAIRVEWVASSPVACTNGSGDNWDGTNKLMLRRAEGILPPSSPTAGELVANLPISATQTDDFVHRSSKKYAYALFACENPSCSSWYADGSGSGEASTNTTVGAETDQEIWKLIGVTGEADVTSVVVDDSSANAPHSFFYPSDWSLVLGNRTSWAAPVLVAEGSTTSTDEDYKADHPWAMLTRDGGARRVQLFLQSQGLANNNIIQIESTDPVGDDFGLSCGAGSCATTILGGGGYVAIDADGTVATDYVKHAQHSRVGWDYIDDPYIDAGTDMPFMMFQMQRPSSGGACEDIGTPDDIGWADGAWDGGGMVWDWMVDTDGGSPDCPVVQIEDGHDNTMIPLPNGEFKLYYKKWDTELWYVTYWNGAVWEDEKRIKFEWDGSSSGPTDNCIENISALAHVTGSNIREGMFFTLLDSNTCPPTGGVGFDDGLPGSDTAIVFAQHVH